MIIWRGFGFIGFLIPLVTTMVFLFMGSALSLPQNQAEALAGLGLLIGGVFTWLAGSRLNGGPAPSKVSATLAERERTYRQWIAEGRFSRGPNFPQPRSREEAEQQMYDQLRADQASLTTTNRNLHTLFFIPLQYAGLVIAAIGAVLAIALYVR